MNTTRPASEYLLGAFNSSELIIALVGAVGAERAKVSRIVRESLERFNYRAEEIRVSKDVIEKVYKQGKATDEFKRIEKLMDLGNKAREVSGDNSILAKGVTSIINAMRDRKESKEAGSPKKNAYIINSLKHPEEVACLRSIYGNGFFLFGVYSDRERRLKYLCQQKEIGKEKAEMIIERDESEKIKHGQRTRDTFYLADFFIDVDKHEDDIRRRIERVINLMFGNPHLTPTFDEYAMFLAFAASLRSADMARQVGAVIGKENEIIATGANDCPKAKGGLYWPVDNPFSNSEGWDVNGGRDYTRGYDSNDQEKERMLDEIVKSIHDLGLKSEKELRLRIKETRLDDITEFGRAVHAEMEALMFCARNGISCREATLYCTTFPCHNCAKHIIAAGIEKVVYVEPYPKSKAIELHSDAATIGSSVEEGKVAFVPFVGVGPQKFLDLFSMRLGSGTPLRRKDSLGRASQWNRKNAGLRTQLLPVSYRDLEKVAATRFRTWMEEIDCGKRKAKLGIANNPKRTTKPS